MTTGEIHVACCVDENYVPHLAALIGSIKATTKAPTTVHVLADDVSRASADKVSAFARPITVRWYDISDNSALSLTPLLQISRATYLRHLIPEVLSPDIARLIYLDIDVIVNADLSHLWDLDLGAAQCGAVTDPGVDVHEFAERFGLAEPGDYFNAGILLLDLHRIREEGSFRTALELLLADRARFTLADQDALNVTLWGNWLGIDPRWNFQRKFLYESAQTAAVPLEPPHIVHFTESTKPWQADEWHPYTWLYLRQLRTTPFYAEIRQRHGLTKRHLLKMWAKYRWRRLRTAR